MYCSSFDTDFLSYMPIDKTVLFFLAWKKVSLITCMNIIQSLAEEMLAWILATSSSSAPEKTAEIQAKELSDLSQKFP